MAEHQNGHFSYSCWFVCMHADITINTGVYGVKEILLLAKIYCTMYLHTPVCVCSCLLRTYLQYLSQSLLLYPQLQLMNTTTAERFIHGTFSRFHASLYKKRSKHLRLISLQKSSGTDFSIFLSVPLLSFFIPSPLLTQALLSGPRNLAHSEKHSWKAFSPPDQGDFLIYSRLCFFFSGVCVCVSIHCSSLLLCMSFIGKIHLNNKQLLAIRLIHLLT